MSNELNMVNNLITNLLNRYNNQEAPTKNYVVNVLKESSLFISTNDGIASLTKTFNIGLGVTTLRNLTSRIVNEFINCYAAGPHKNSGQNNVGIGYILLSFRTAINKKKCMWCKFVNKLIWK